MKRRSTNAGRGGVPRASRASHKQAGEGRKRTATGLPRVSNAGQYTLLRVSAGKFGGWAR